MIKALPHLITLSALAFAFAAKAESPARPEANRSVMVEGGAGQSAPAMGAARQASVRCAAAFALIAGQQARGGARGYPPMDLRGRENMVRVGGALIDDGADEAQVSAAMRDAAAALADPATLAAVMPPCLSLLDAEVPTFAPPTLPQCVVIARRAGDAALADRLEARLRAEMAAAGRAANEADAILAAETAAGTASEGEATGRHDAATCEALAKAG